jgi:LytS/YehU family sensor histidine kinase
MLVQPFVENAVIHGMRNRKEPGGKVGIYSKKAGNLLKVTIEDNGVGRAKAMEIKAALPTAHQSLSMELTLSRLEALHGHKRHHEYLIFTDLADEHTGTRVDIFIPINTIR